MSGDSHDRDFAEDKPAKRPRAAKKTGERNPRSRPARPSLSWEAIAKIAFWGALLGGFLTALGLYRHGHAASWRAIAIIAAHTVPLLPGLWLVQLLSRFLARLGFGLAATLVTTLLATVLVMALLPTTALYLANHIGPMADELETPQTLFDYVLGFGALGYMYLATGFKYWWPLGGLLPLYMGFWHWRWRR